MRYALLLLLAACEPRSGLQETTKAGLPSGIHVFEHDGARCYWWGGFRTGAISCIAMPSRGCPKMLEECNGRLALIEKMSHAASANPDEAFRQRCGEALLRGQIGPNR